MFWIENKFKTNKYPLTKDFKINEIYWNFLVDLVDFKECKDGFIYGNIEL